MRAAERHPEKVAVVLGEERLTYGELELESNRLAWLLADSGCRSGDRVCLVLPKSPSAIAAMLGVLKAGAAYVPIDVSSPAPRVESIVRACEPRLVLACEETAELTEELSLSGALSMGVGLLDDSTGPDGARAGVPPRRLGGRERRPTPAKGLPGGAGTHPVHLGLHRRAEGGDDHPRERHPLRRSGPPPTSGPPPRIGSPATHRFTSTCRPLTSTGRCSPEPSSTWSRRRRTLSPARSWISSATAS